MLILVSWGPVQALPGRAVMGTPHLLCVADRLTDFRLVAPLCRAGLSVPDFQQHLLTSCLFRILVVLAMFQPFSLLFYLLRRPVSCGYDSLKPQGAISGFEQ